MDILEEKIYRWITERLEDSSFEDVLEEYDLSPQEVFVYLFNSGLVKLDLGE